MKTRRAGLGLLVLGAFLIGLRILLEFNPTILHWVGIQTFVLRYGLPLPLRETFLFGLYATLRSFAPFGGMISIVLGVGFLGL